MKYLNRIFGILYLIVAMALSPVFYPCSIILFGLDKANDLMDAITSSCFHLME